MKNINIYLPPVLPALSLDNPHTGSKVPAALGLQSLFLFRPTPLNLQDQHILPLQTLPSPRSRPQAAGVNLTFLILSIFFPHFFIVIFPSPINIHEFVI